MICERHRKFAAYWEEIGKPSVEYMAIGSWYPVKAERPRWEEDKDYRIAGDPHWELRRKWVDSDKTLPIEVLSVCGDLGAWMPCNNLTLRKDIKYREAPQAEPTWPEVKMIEEQVKEVEQLTIDKTLDERGKRYGNFKGHAQITQSIKSAMQVGNWDNLSVDKREALEMIAHKVGRILNGDPEYHDSWHDIVGYAKLVADSLIVEDGANAN